jgi:hypothetical protein
MNHPENKTRRRVLKPISALVLVLLGVTLWGRLLVVLFPPVAITQLHKLGQQISRPDRVVLIAFDVPAPLRAEFTGAEAQKLIRAVSQSKPIPTVKDSAPNCPGGMSIMFYKGTNLLTQVPGHDDHFHISETFYHDDSRALEAAWQAVYNRQ